MKLQRQIFSVFLAILLCGVLFAGYTPASPVQVARVTLSACALARNIQLQENADIYVLGDDAVAKELKKLEGWQVGNLVISSVRSGDTLPATKPTVIVCGDIKDVELVRSYCQDNNVLSIGTSPESWEKGLSLSLYQKNSDSQTSLSGIKLLLNLDASTEENVYWEPSVSMLSDNL